VLPGGFSYGDYLRCGAIAARAPIMGPVREHARKGGLVMGVCNGFQILCEAELLPGILLRNASVKFICRDVHLKVERSDTPFWDYVRTMEVPDSLAEKMELFRRRGRVVKYREGVFLDASWIAVYLGQGIIPVGHDLRADAPSPESLVAGMRKLISDVGALAASMEDHAAYLRRYCPMAEAA